MTIASDGVHAPVQGFWVGTTRRLTCFLIAIGIVLRVASWLQSPDLWLDEVFLSSSVVHRDFAGLLKPFDFDQMAPIGFVWLEKASTLVFGQSERALRLPSLIGGVALLFLLPRVSRLLIPDRKWLPPLAVFLAAFNPVLVRYSSEAKPYGCDAFVALVLFGLLAWTREKDWSAKRIMVCLPVFALAPWFSFTAVYFLAGAGLATLFGIFMERRWKVAGRVSVPFLAAACFTIYMYVVFLRHNPNVTTEEQGFALAGQYPSLWVSSGSSLSHLGDFMILIVCGVPGFVSAMAGLAVLVYMMGARMLLRMDAMLFGWIVMPIAVVFGFSLFHLYPLTVRTILFCAPGITLLTALGLLSLARASRQAGALMALVSCVMLTASPVFWDLVRLAHPFARQHLTDVMREVAAKPQNATLLVVDGTTAVVFDFYNEWKHFDSIAPVLGPHSWYDGFDAQKARIDKLTLGTRFWFILPEISIGTETERTQTLNYLRGRAREIDKIEKLDSAAYLFELPSVSAQGG